MKTKRALTLIELTLYIAIVSIFMLSLTTLLWNTIWGKSKNNSQTEVYDNLTLVINKIEYEMGQSSDINLSGASDITFTNVSTSTSRMYLQNGRIKYGVGSSGSCTVSSPCNLSSNLVNVDQFNLRIVEDNGNKILNYTVEISFNDNSNSRLSFSDSLSGSILLNR